MNKKILIFIISLSFFSLLHADNTESLQYSFQIAEKAYQEKDYLKAVEYYKAIIILDKTKKNKVIKKIAQCYDHIAFDFEKKGEFRDAEWYYIEAINHDQKNHEFYLHLAHLYSTTGDQYNAIRLYQKAIELGADKNVYDQEIQKLNKMKLKKENIKYSLKCPNCKQNIPENVIYCPYCRIKNINYRSDRKLEKPEYFHRIEFGLYLGRLGGKKSPVIGWTSELDEIKVEIGGGTDFGLMCNYYFHPHLKVHMSIGYYSGSLEFPVQDVDGSFSRIPVRLGLLPQYELGRLFGSCFSLYGGPVAGLYLNPKYKQNWVGKESYLNYRPAMGVEIVAGIYISDSYSSSIFCLIEVRYISVKYKLKDGMYEGVGLVPGTTKHKWRELDGEGGGLYCGLGVRL